MDVKDFLEQSRTSDPKIFVLGPVAESIRRLSFLSSFTEDRFLVFLDEMLKCPSCLGRKKDARPCRRCVANP